MIYSIRLHNKILILSINIHTINTINKNSVKTNTNCNMGYMSDKVLIKLQYSPRIFLEQWARYTAKEELANQLTTELLIDNFEKNNDKYIVSNITIGEAYEFNHIYALKPYKIVKYAISEFKEAITKYIVKSFLAEKDVRKCLYFFIYAANKYIPKKHMGL